MFKRISAIALLLWLVHSTAYAQLCENLMEPVPTGSEKVIASLGGVSLVRRQLTQPCDEFIASIIEARAESPSSRLVTLTNISFSNVHQVRSSLQSDQPIGPPEGALNHPDWAYLDSHLLFTEDMIAGGVYSFWETNDRSTTDSISLPTVLDGAGVAQSGLGSIKNGHPTDGFFFKPDFQSPSIDLAYIVTRVGRDVPPTGMTVGVLGSGIVDAGLEGGAAFGYDGNLNVPLFGGVDPGPPPIENRIGSIISPTSFTETKEFIAGGQVEFKIPVQTAPAPDNDANYYVSLVDIDERQIADGFDHSRVSLSSLWADQSRDLSVFFRGDEVGEFKAEYSFSFDDGTIVDAFLTANVLPRPVQPPVDPPVNIGACSTEPEIGGQPAFARLGGVTLFSIPVDIGRDDLFAAKVVACGERPDSKLVTLTNLSFSNTHQVWSSLGGPNALGRPIAGPIYHEDWVPLDSHLLISDQMIGGGVYGVSEENDGNSTLVDTLPTTAATASALVGYGSIANDTPNDAFFLAPEFQDRVVEVAYIVSDGSRPVEMTLGILGSGITDAGSAGGAAFGYDGNPTVRFPLSIAIPEPKGSVSMPWMLAVVAFVRRRRFPCSKSR